MRVPSVVSCSSSCLRLPANYCVYNTAQHKVLVIVWNVFVCNTLALETVPTWRISCYLVLAELSPSTQPQGATVQRFVALTQSPLDHWDQAPRHRRCVTDGVSQARSLCPSNPYAPNVTRDLRWWADVSLLCACLRWFPALVPAFVCLPEYHVSLYQHQKTRKTRR